MKRRWRRRLVLVVVLAAVAIAVVAGWHYHDSSTCQLQRAFGIKGSSLADHICSW